MKAKILFSVATACATTICSGAGGPVSGGMVVGPVRAPTSANPGLTTSPNPGLTTSQTPELTVPQTVTPVQPGVNVNPNMTGGVNGNGSFASTNGGFNGLANTNSFSSITNMQGNAPGGVIALQPGVNSQLPAGNTLPLANSPMRATVAPAPGVNSQSAIVPSGGANTTANVVPPTGANTPQQSAQAPASGINSTPPSP